MSSMYFYLYAAEQPVVGYLADRIGPRRVIGWWSVAAAAGCLLFDVAPTIGVIIGAPFFGWLTDRFALCKRDTVIGIIVGYGLTWTGLIFFHSPLGALGISAMLLIMGIAAGGFISAVWGLVRESTPQQILGLTSGLLNPAPFLGVAAFQVLTGTILDHAGRVGDTYPVAGFQSAFMTCLIGIAACLALSFLIRKSD